MFTLKKDQKRFTWRYLAAGAMTFAGVLGSLAAARYRHQNPDGKILPAFSSNGRHDKDADYDTWTKEELYEKAQDMELEGRSSMTKAELIDALEQAA
jgi:hypothetical protein